MTNVKIRTVASILTTPVTIIETQQEVLVWSESAEARRVGSCCEILIARYVPADSTRCRVASYKRGV